MRNFLRKNTAVVVLLACTAAISAESTPPVGGGRLEQWQQLHDRAQNAYASGDLAMAEQAIQQALAEARAGQGQTGPFIASSLNVLALVRQQQGHLTEAIDLLRQALAVSEQALGAHANTASIALNLARAQEAVQPAQAAVQGYEKALALAEQSNTTSIRDQALTALARMHLEAGRTEQAAALHQRLLSNHATLSPALRSETLLREGLRLQQAGQLSQARQALEQALQAAEQAYGTADAQVLSALSALASVYSGMDQLDQAALLHRRAVDILQAHSPGDVALAGHFNELALWHWQRKEYAQASPLLDEALQLVRQHHGAQSLQAANILSSQAQLQDAQGNEHASRQLHEQALATFRAQGTVDEQALLGQARSLNFLAGFDYRRRLFAKAEPRFLEALALLEQAGGADDERLLDVLHNLVALYTSQGKPALARPYNQRLDAIERSLRTGAAVP